MCRRSESDSVHWQRRVQACARELLVGMAVTLAQRSGIAEPLPPGSHVPLRAIAEPLTPGSRVSLRAIAEPLTPGSRVSLRAFAEPLMPGSRVRLRIRR